MARLSSIGVEVDGPSHTDVLKTWETLRCFADEPVEDALVDGPWGDAWVAQHGHYGGGTFVLDVTRQFQFADRDGAYSHMAQLRCGLYFKPFPGLKGLPSARLWSVELSLDDFFREALELPGFARVREHQAAPKALIVEYSDV